MHGNFIVNTNGAHTSDSLALVEEIRKKPAKNAASIWKGKSKSSEKTSLLFEKRTSRHLLRE